LPGLPDLRELNIGKGVLRAAQVRRLSGDEQTKIERPSNEADDPKRSFSSVADDYRTTIPP